MLLELINGNHAKEQIELNKKTSKLKHGVVIKKQKMLKEIDMSDSSVFRLEEKVESVIKLAKNNELNDELRKRIAKISNEEVEFKKSS